MNDNRLVLGGQVTELADLRYTPAGIPLLAFTLSHTSQQHEAGMKRQSECEIPVIAMDELAEQAGTLQVGSQVRVAGFLCRKSLHSRQLVLHINELEMTEKG